MGNLLLSSLWIKKKKLECLNSGGIWSKWRSQCSLHLCVPFWGPVHWESLEKGGYLSCCTQPSFLTALRVPSEAPKSGWRGTEVGEYFFSEGSFLWHTAQGVLAFACCSNVSLPVAHFSFCFVPQLTKQLLQAPDTILKQDCFPLPRPSGFQAHQSSHHASPEGPWTQLIKAVDEIKLFQVAWKDRKDISARAQICLRGWVT